VVHIEVNTTGTGTLQTTLAVSPFQSIKKMMDADTA
jgi:hypothetical protein